MPDKIFRLLLSISLCFIPGFFGGIFTQSSINSWYVSLTKPFFSPPGFVFGPVWTVLYILMGISLYLVWTAKVQEKGRKVRAITLFVTQLVLNGFWSFIFFGLRNPTAALVEILILWVAIAIVIWKFAKISKPAASLLLPYILWVSFAALLNLYIVLLN